MRKEHLRWLLITLLGAAALTPDVARKWGNTQTAELLIPSPTPTPEIVQKGELFEKVMVPFKREAQRRREERAQNDPEYSKRIDQELNEGRVNLLLYGYGETHEPPLTEHAIIGSNTIVSIDTKERKIDLVSLTHDIRAPEVERYRAEKGLSSDFPVKIDRAYHDGGFELMRETLENATGLSIDFQIAFRDRVIVDFVDSVFGGVEVDVPQAFDVHPFYLEGIKFDRGHFPAGRQTLNGLEVIQFIKTVPDSGGRPYYGKQHEHNQRKHIVFKEIARVLEDRADAPGFWFEMLKFLNKKRKEQDINYDFDSKSLLMGNIGDLARIGFTLIIRGDTSNSFPDTNKTVYVVDLCCGDGGVQWVPAAAENNPIIAREVREGFYGRSGFGDPYAFEIPLGGNPYAEDLVTGYWKSVRNRIKELLLAP
ncbi:LCP family protein [Candidatus Microgenomates bacterium]|nr:LCP family protein [Candidatus Microgenomates bacterium]